jgi:uncharacterized protein (DUF433 family)
MNVHPITLPENLYAALQHRARQHRQTTEALVEEWLKQLLNLERYPHLEWRQGAGGWRTGVKGTAIDVYTVAGYSQAGYSPREIADTLLPQLSIEQVQTALQYYADHPAEIDKLLAENEPEIAKARLYRALGPVAYRQVTGQNTEPSIIQEARSKYRTDESD